VIVVVTDDFEVYHGVVNALRERGVTFTTREVGTDLEPDVDLLVTGPDEDVGELRPGIEVIRADPDDPRQAVEEALAVLRGSDGRTVVGVDPGDRPGIAVLSGGTVVAAFRVPLADAADAVIGEVEDAVDPLVRIGDGARLQGAQIVDGLEGVPVELVDETGTTPYLGAGARGMGDVLAAVNIARLDGERIEERDVEPTAGEIQSIKDRSRRESGDVTVGETLARRVALGELTMEEAIDRKRDAGGGDGGDGS